ncbi:MAG: PGPGW domain-containing protein [Alphaproteobacteria bacterium]
MATLYRRFQAVFGWALIAVGLVVLPLPIPLGAIMIVIGIAMVAPTSPGVRDVLRKVRTRFPSFDRTLEGWRPHLPNLIRTLIEDTRPEPTMPQDADQT